MDESDLVARKLELVDLCAELTEALRKANDRVEFLENELRVALKKP